jgi:uncharacterized protein (DUF1697 family)
VRAVALLKGINVGGHKKVPMAELRAALAESGFGESKTLLQSGNVILDCDPSGFSGLSSRLEALVQDRFGVSSKVVVRSSEELDEVASSDPLLEAMSDPSRHLIGFASDPPSPERSSRLADGDYGENLLAVVGKHVYMWCPQGLSASPFFKMDLDRILGVTVTLRNWRTVTSLIELVNAP